jgi:chlorite dismutase
LFWVSFANPKQFDHTKGLLMNERTLNHYTFFAFSDLFWSLPAQKRADFHLDWARDLQGVAACTHFYQVSPLRADTDGLVWCALPVEHPNDSAGFFDALTHTLNERRAFIRPVQTLWGYTRPSSYARGTSSQEIDPLSAQRAPYLVLYPFVKTIDWYLLGKDTRQGMMNEHIRVGHQYPEIKQLLLYSFGLQDQEFVVVYETEDLAHFSDLVNELRSTEVRRYTERDTPIYTGVWHTPQQMAALHAPRPEAV